jgi:DNA-binding transcriptional MerR regulator
MVTEQHINLSLEQLADEVAYALEYYNLLGAHSDSRVSPVPDARTIRYYTTIGLLDRPRVEGRQAKYGKRQLLQLLTIKALQSHGLPLADIQSRIYGRSEAELESLLTGLAGGTRSERRDSLRAVVWREITIAPGLKIMVEEGWMPNEPLKELTRKIEAALDALKDAPDGSTGGN